MTRTKQKYELEHSPQPSSTAERNSRRQRDLCVRVALVAAWSGACQHWKAIASTGQPVRAPRRVYTQGGAQASPLPRPTSLINPAMKGALLGPPPPDQQANPPGDPRQQLAGVVPLAAPAAPSSHGAADAHGRRG